MTVFVVQNQQFIDPRTGKLTTKFVNLEQKAKGFGEVRYLLSPTAGPWNGEIVNDLKEGLKDFSDSDFLLLIGNPALIGLAVAVAVITNNGRAKLLQWHGTEGKYIPINAQVFSPLQIAEKVKLSTQEAGLKW